MRSDDHQALAAVLSEAGFIAADEEAHELIAGASGDATRLNAMVTRRLTGEPLAWITGRVVFCGVELHIDPGVYVPRWQSKQLASRAARRLPTRGVAIDVCTGSGAIAKVLMAAAPASHVVATDVAATAVACATGNGVDALLGDLFEPLPEELLATADVVTGVVPYVPTGELPLLQRDTFSFETPLAYDGGPDGTDVLRRVVVDARHWLRPGGALLLELGGPQAEALRDDLERLGYVDVERLVDDEGDLRGIEATFTPR